MTRQEFMEIAGYFANPIRNTRIEVEGRPSIINRYALRYAADSGLPFPIGADSITVLDENANKWGREMRIYFSTLSGSIIPPILDGLKTSQGRPGYDTWNLRLNNRDIIDDLILIGFTIGDPQDLARIQSNIPLVDNIDFNNGYNLP